MGIEGGFEAAHESLVGARGAPDVEAAFELGGTPEKRGNGGFSRASGEDVRGDGRKLRRKIVVDGG